MKSKSDPQRKKPAQQNAERPARKRAHKRAELLAGFHAVSSALQRAPQDIINLWVDRTRHDPRIRQLLEQAAESGVSVVEVDRSELDRVAAGLRHQGVVAEARMAALKNEEELYQLVRDLQHNALLLVLDQVQDPHNLGACLRTAECAGVNAVVLPRDGAAPVNDTVRRVAAGAAERVPVFAVTNLARCLEQIQQLGVWVIGTSDRAEQSIHQVDFRVATAVVMGGEEKGLRRLTLAHCDQVASIPMAGSVASLNVSVAAGVTLFEAVRQRQD